MVKDRNLGRHYWVLMEPPARRTAAWAQVLKANVEKWHQVPSK